MNIDAFVKIPMSEGGFAFLRLDKIVYIICRPYKNDNLWRLYICYGELEESYFEVEFSSEKICVEYAEEIMQKVNGFIEHKTKTLGQIT